MTAPSPVRQLADSFTTRLLEASPFAGTALGMREYDPLVPDASRAAEEALATDLAAFAAEAAVLTPTTDEDEVTLGVVASMCRNRQFDLANRQTEYTVTAMPMTGPPLLFALLARTSLVDTQACDDYLERLRRSAAWIDATTERLREGAAARRSPVGTLVDQALAWADHALANSVPPALLTPQPPEGWSGAAAWRTGIETVASDIQAAVARWRDQVAALRPAAREDDAVSIASIPGGAADYERCVAVHTTLAFDAAEIHAIGLAEVARLKDRLLELGSTIGLSSLEDIIEAMRNSTKMADPQVAMAAAQAAIQRAEAVAHEMMPAPLPDPCVVTPMPQTVAESGMAPHYTRPRLDGSRPGTYWFNTQRPTAGTGWDLEAVAFHEAVPGHHAQLARLQHLPDLPLVQQMGQTVYAEGWGLYSERLAGEFGLYSDVQAEIGAISMEMHRAVRLVVDTGLHAHGWSRQRAIDYARTHVALPESFLTNEIDRYIAWPGQALAYMIGQREILRLRDEARTKLGDRFDLPSFHAVVLDSGSLPMPVLAHVVDRYAKAAAV